MQIKRCECMSTEFIISESTVYKANVNSSSELQTYSIQESSIDDIFCIKCQKHYKVEDFETVDIN